MGYTEIPFLNRFNEWTFYSAFWKRLAGILIQKNCIGNFSVLIVSIEDSVIRQVEMFY